MPVERRGQAIRVMISLVNWQQEEPIGCGGGRQLLLDGTSRVTGDCHARFCERLGVKSPGATRRRSAMVVPTATLSGFGIWKNEHLLFADENGLSLSCVDVSSGLTEGCQIRCATVPIA